MKLFFLTVCTLVIIEMNVFACANMAGPGTSKSGELHSVSRTASLQIRSNIKRDGSDARMLELANRLQGATDLKSRNDYAVALMHLGRAR
ncbi:MAG: hypothetical protein JWN25_2035, partial [Verrucomicrobiales bacterium]|nr:hypothetical protein [Verrucomicrobiales bacterium]